MKEKTKKLDDLYAKAVSQLAEMGKIETRVEKLEEQAPQYAQAHKQAAELRQKLAFIQEAHGRDAQLHCELTHQKDAAQDLVNQLQEIWEAANDMENNDDAERIDLLLADMDKRCQQLQSQEKQVVERMGRNENRIGLLQEQLSAAENRKAAAAQEEFTPVSSTSRLNLRAPDQTWGRTRHRLDVDMQDNRAALDAAMQTYSAARQNLEQPQSTSRQSTNRRQGMVLQPQEERLSGEKKPDATE